MIVAHALDANDPNKSDSPLMEAFFWVTFGAHASNGFTKEQLCSTASYKKHELLGIRLGANDQTGWNFAGQNHTGATFGSSTLTGADLTNVVVVGASFGGATGVTK